MKYQLVNVEQQELLAKGICERVGSAEAFHKHGLDKNEEVIDAKMADHDDAMALVLESLTSGPTKAIDSLEEIDAVGHRIVQGGKYFDRSNASSCRSCTLLRTVSMTSCNVAPTDASPPRTHSSSACTTCNASTCSTDLVSR